MRWAPLLVLVVATGVQAQERAPERAAAEQRSIADAMVVPAEADCLTHDALVEHTQTWLAREAIDARTSIVVELGDDERHDVGFALLDRSEPFARRTFARLPEPCADRRAAFSLALAIALDASVLERLGVPQPEEPTPEPEPSPEPTPSEQAALDDADDVDDAEPRSEPLHFDVAADVGVGLGLLPHWAWLGGLELALRGDGWQVRVAGRVSSRPTSSIGTGRARTQLGFAELGGCMHAQWPVVVRACLGVALGRLVGEGIGFAQVHEVRLWWAAGTAELSARWPSTGPVALRVGARGHVKWVRPTLSVESPEGGKIAENRPSIGGVTGFLGVVFSLR